jgi:hypothetical protein
MEHPFNLQLEDLETLDFDLMEESEVTGGVTFTTLALGEEGGHCPLATKPPLPWCGTPIPRPPLCPPTKPPIKPPIFTTLALGEEGGDPFI